MAPPKTQNGGAMKQKSLMGWLNKEPSSSKSSPAAESKKPVAAANAQVSKLPVRSERVQGIGAEESSRKQSTSDDIISTPKWAEHGPSSSMKSLVSISSIDEPILNDTPPTSDAMDVELLFEGTFKEQRSSKSAKRKIIPDDSDDDAKKVSHRIRNVVDKAESMAHHAHSSPTERAAKSKKPRMSIIDSDNEESDEDSRQSFSKRLSRFRRPSSQSLSDLDGLSEYNPPAEDSEVEAVPKTSSRRGSSTSRSNRSSDFDEDDDADSDASDLPKKRVKRPPIKPSGYSVSTSERGSNSFLTAAEQREKNKKTEKKSGEDPFDFLKDVRDKDGNRPGQPNYDPRTLYIPKSAWKSFTPFEKQFWEIKQNHYDTVLFFQKGKFLELYEDDARIGHQEFDLKLTERVKMSMVGVPEMSFNFWAAKFLAKGYKVGRVDQAETALGAEMRLAADKEKSGKSKGSASGDKIVRRELNKVYTNGTLVDAELLTDEQAGHCVALREVDPESDKGSFGICVLDTSTSEFNLCTFNDDPCRTKLETLMRQLRVKELLFTKGNLSVSTTRLLKTVLSGSCLWTSLRECEGFNYKETLEELEKIYPVDEDAMEESSQLPEAIRSMLTCESAVTALGSMIWYLRQLNIDKDILSMKNFNVYDPMKRGQGLVLDGQALAHVEVLQNNEGTEDGSLLKILGRCITPFGKRLFRIWLCMPLREVKAINARLDAVQDLMNHPTYEADFTDLVKGMPDLERIVSRIHAKNCKVKDFLKVLQSFKRLSRGLETLSEVADSFDSNCISGLLRGSPDLLPYVKNLEAMFKKPESDNDDLIPEDGRDEIYDEIMKEIRELESFLENRLDALQDKLGISLSYWHSGIGAKEIYLVQTSSKEKKIPKDWTKSGSTKSNARWVVPELAKPIRQMKEARERKNGAIKEFKFRLFAEFDRDRDVWLRAVRTLAELDCLFSLAKASSAIGEPSCRPEFEDTGSASLAFEELRHPAMCLRSENFIPNDIKLGGHVGRVALLTGPNMGGKSTVMRMTAAGVIMAQLGMLVPAKSARLSPVDTILTRMGAYDNMFSNSSTFKVELDECNKILREATPRSLVILDELGRGTSTYDGMAIAGAVLHQLATQTLPLCFFATHYGSLTDDFAYHPNIRNMHMSTIVDDEKRELVFLYKLVEGIASSSFGTHVANLAGVPKGVTKRADVISTDFAKQFKERIEGKRTSTLPLVAQADFSFLLRLVKGEARLPEEKTRRREILRNLRLAASRYLQASH